MVNRQAQRELCEDLGSVLGGEPSTRLTALQSSAAIQHQSLNKMGRGRVPSCQYLAGFGLLVDWRVLVEPGGIEPPTSSLRTTRSPS